MGQMQASPFVTIRSMRCRARIAGFAALLGAVLFFGQGLSVASAQGVGNYDFETCNPSFWLFYAPSGGIWGVDNAANHTPGGRCAAHIVDSGQTPKPAIYQEPTPPQLVVRGRYNLSAWMKADSGETGYLGWYSNNGGNRQCNHTTTTGSWQQLACEFMVPANTTYFNVSLWPNGVGGGRQVYADDVSFSLYLPNAIGHKSLTARGAMADIEFFDSYLNGGLWIYYRTGVRNPPNFAEIGWQKREDGSFVGLAAWRDVSTGQTVNRTFPYSTGRTHNFAVQNIGSTQKYDFYYDYQYVGIRTDTPGDSGFYDANDVFSGGEVVSGTEFMSNLLHANNKYLVWMNGQWIYVPYSWSSSQLIEQQNLTYHVYFWDGDNWQVGGPYN